MQAQTSVVNFHKRTSYEKPFLDWYGSNFDKRTRSIKVTLPIKVTSFHGIILFYLAVCHDLQYQKLLEGLGICSLLFFINFNNFNYIQIKIYNGMLCRFAFLEVRLFFMQNFMFINEFNKPGVH